MDFIPKIDDMPTDLRRSHCPPKTDVIVDRLKALSDSSLLNVPGKIHDNPRFESFYLSQKGFLLKNWPPNVSPTQNSS